MTTPMSPAVPPALDARGLRKSYGPVHAVRGVDLRIEHGEVVALLGPNGAGKSTTVDMLLGLSRPDAGTVEAFGMSPKDAAKQGRIGATLQAGGILDGLTVRELVDVMRSLYPQPLAAAEILKLAGIEDLAERRTTKLSGGQTQRVRFAQAVAGDPQLLVLDEPTAAMDVTTRRAFWSTMRDWTSQGRTVVFATHYLEEADAFADRVVLMANGQVVADGAITEIRAMVGGRTIRATLAGADPQQLQSFPGVSGVEVHGDTVVLRCDDSDAALRALVPAYPELHDIEISSAGLEDAFIALTGVALTDGAVA